MSKFSTTESYDALRKYLTRAKFENPGCLTRLLFETFVTAEFPTNYQVIKINDLRIRGILPSKRYPDFKSWRKDMRIKGILICMAGKEELNDTSANIKASKFKFGDFVKKYIESALLEQKSILERLDSKASSKKVDELEEKIIKLIAYILFKNPPDNHNRRIIAENFYNDPEKMEKLLEAELDEAKNLARNHLKIVESGDSNEPF